MNNGYCGFAEYAKDLFNEPVLADVEILLDNDQDQENGAGSTRTFYGHRVVLATMSDYFLSMLVKAEKREIRLKDVPYSTFELCMRFVYCGWDDRLTKLTLDEAEQFFRMARVLMIDSKVEDLFCDWLKMKLERWESEIWRIIKFAIELDVEQMVKLSIEHFSFIASCGLKMDGFLDASLATVQKVIAKKFMSCSKVELHDAITRWVKANNVGLNKKDQQKLFDDIAMFPTSCYFGNQIRISKQQDPSKTKKLKVAANKPTAKAPQESLESPRECSFLSEMQFQQCLTLFGVTLMFRSIERVRSQLIVDFSITELYRDKIALCNRKVRIDCDFTQPQQDNNTLSRNIFFKPIKVCRSTTLNVAVKWTASGGVQPTVCLFGTADQDYVYVRSSHCTHFTHIFCRNQVSACSRCKEDSECSDSS